MQGLSAGRVQSVATRIVVERERERMAFRAGTWWSLSADLRTDKDETFSALLDTRRRPASRRRIRLHLDGVAF